MTVPKHLKILYRLSPRVHVAVCAALCEGCRCGVPSKLEGAEWMHYVTAAKFPCCATTYRTAIAPERSRDFAVFEAAVTAGHKASGL